jgi:hypothetical protein
MLHLLAKGSSPPARYATKITSVLRSLGGVAWLPDLTAAVWDACLSWDELGAARLVRAAAADPASPVHLAVNENGLLFACLEHPYVV